jgi:DNA-binding Lrp family transcriptional regulator
MRPLTADERRVLGSLELDALKPHFIVAQETSITEKQVKRHIDSLVERKFVHRLPVVEMYRLGYTEYTLFLSFSQDEATTQEKVLQLVLPAEEVVWIAKLEGHFSLGLSVRARRTYEVGDFIENTFLGLKDVVRHKAFAARLTFTFYGTRSLRGQDVKSAPVVFGRDRVQPTIDEVDELILNTLAMSRMGTTDELSARLQMDRRELESRLQHLEERNLIAGWLYMFDFSNVEPTHYKFLVSTHGISFCLTRGLEELLERDPHVLYYAECFGGWDYEIGAEIQDDAQLRTFVHKLQEYFGERLNELRSLRVLDYSKHLNYSF